MAGYSKELIVGAFLHRFKQYIIVSESFEESASRWYDEFGKDEFRKLGAVTPDVIKSYKAHLSSGKPYNIDENTAPVC